MGHSKTYFSLENLIFQKLSGTAEITCVFHAFDVCNTFLRFYRCTAMTSDWKTRFSKPCLQEPKSNVLWWFWCLYYILYYIGYVATRILSMMRHWKTQFLESCCEQLKSSLVQVSALYRHKCTLLIMSHRKTRLSKNYCVKLSSPVFTMILMSLVILQVFCAIQTKTRFLHYGSLGNLIFWKLKKKAAQFTCFMVVSTPVVQTCLTTAWRTQ